jgi:voltage-gated potassium channel
MATDPWDRKQDDVQHSARWRALFGLEEWLRMPMAVLSAIWLTIIILDLTGNSNRLLAIVATVIWAIFLVEFGARLIIAPEKLRFLKRNVLTVVALIVPALRLLGVFAIVRAIGVVRGVSLVRVVGVVNRSMNALRRTLKRRAFGYVIGLTAVVWFAGAAGMFNLEPSSEVRSGFTSYWDALWWTGMLLTSIGSQYWPQTAEGRVLGFLLSLYGLGVLGYITATIASFFIGRDAENEEGEVAGAAEMKRLREEVAALREALTAPARARRSRARRAPSARATKGREAPSKARSRR